MNLDVIVKNLNEIKQLCEEDAPIIASKRIEWLINDIKEHQNKLSFWDILTGKRWKYK